MHSLIMLLKTAIKHVETSNIFKEFKKENPEVFLAHAFTIIHNLQGDWQLGYYSKTKDKVVVFEIGKQITRSPEEEVFKKPEDRVKPLNMKNVSITLEDAIEIAEKLVKEKYSAEIVSKIIAILQNLGTEIFNLTLITQTFNIINVRIDSKTGKILSEARQSIMGLRKE